jgi:hypothetical protein
MSTTTTIIKLKIRRDTAADWTKENPKLAEGEFGYETDTGKLKIGDGTKLGKDLGYFTGATGPQGPTGPSGGSSATGATGPAGSGVTNFDGGEPDTQYLQGPVFDLGTPI